MKSFSQLIGIGLEAGPALMDELDFSDVPDGDWRIGGYELLEELGRGGMGVIYKAREPRTGRIVALKRLRFEIPEEKITKEAVSRLHNETVAVASLDHPNILPIYEIGKAGDSLPFYTMKLAARGCLAKLPRPIERRRAVTWMMKVARAVQHAHNHGILHRDLKPANIMLDAQDEPLVGDFGLAKWLDRHSDLTQTLTALGTPGFLAPEQALGRDLNVEADIYSIGAILFELLTGRPPFVGTSALSVLKQASETPAPKLRSLIPSIDRDLDTICAHCLEQDPKDRYPTADALAEDLQRWLECHPIAARPLPLGEIGVRWVNRNRLLSGVAFLALAFAITGGVREAENKRLATEAEIREQASNAVAVMPLLDIDFVSSDTPPALESTRQISQGIEQSGRTLSDSSHAETWTRSFAEEAKARRVPYLIVGVTRQVQGARRFTLHWFDAAAGDFTRRLSADVPESDSGKIVTKLATDLLEGKGSITRRGKTGPTPKYDLLAAAQDYYQRSTAKSLDQAISCARKLVSEKPDSVAGYCLLGLSLNKRSWLGVDNPEYYIKESIAAVDKAIQLAPNDPEVYQAKAEIDFVSGKFDEALQADLTYLELSMKIDKAAGIIGDVVRVQRRPDLARKWFRLGNDFSSKPDFASLEADVLMDLGFDAEAKDAYQKFADIFPDKPSGVMGLCCLTLLQGNFSEADAIARKLLEDFPTEAYAPLMAAEVAFYSGNYARSLELYQQMIQIERTGGSFFYGSISYLSGAGFSMIQLGQKEAGVALLQEAVHSEEMYMLRAPADKDHLMNLLATEAALGRLDEAFNKFEANIDALFANHRFIQRDPRFAAFRNDPRFPRLEQEMKSRVALMSRNVAKDLATNKANTKTTIP